MRDNISQLLPIEKKIVSYTDHTCWDRVVIVQGRALLDELVWVGIQGWDAMVKAEWITKHKVPWIVKEMRMKYTH